MQIVAFEEAHAAEAAALVAAGARRARADEPLLPPVLEDEAGIAERVVGLGSVGLAVTAVDDGAVVGFAGALPYRLWGRPGAFVPLWGWAVADAGIVAPLYAEVSQRWAGAGAVTHTLSVFATDEDLEEAWHGLGFGRVIVHAVRNPAPNAIADGVRRAGPDDVDAVAELEYRLWKHLGGPPTLRIAGEPTVEEIDELMSDDDRPVWLAERAGDVVAYVGAALHHGDAPLALDHPSVGHVTAAFVAPEVRGYGVGRSLVAVAEAWLADRGCAVTAVEFESANVEAVFGWAGMGFDPVVHALVRRTV